MNRIPNTLRSIGLVASCLLLGCGARTTLEVDDGSVGSSDAVTDAADGAVRDATPDVPVDESSFVDVPTPPVDVFTPDIVEFEASTPDVFVPDVFVPDVFVPDVFVPDVFVPDVFDAGPPADIVDVPVGPTCPLPVAGVLTLPSTVSGTLAGANNIPSTTCVPAAGGPESIYSLHLDATTGVSLLTGGALDTVLSIRTACDVASSEIACDDDHGPGARSSIRQVLTPGDYFVIVDRFGAGGAVGAFTLDASSFTPVANSNCASATPLTPGTPVRGDTRTATAYPRGCLLPNEGPELFYTLTIPPGRRASITAQPDAATFRASVRVRDNCTSATCVSSATATADGAAANVIVDNHDPSTSRTVIVSVGSMGADTNGTFTLDATVSPYPSASNNVCSMATTIADGTMLRGEDLSAATDSLASACLPTASGRVLYYTATIPAQSTLDVRVAPTGFDAVVRVLDACGATSCIANVNAGFGNAPETLRFENASATPRTIVVAVGSTNATTGLFDLSASIRRAAYSIETIAANCDDMTSATVLPGVDRDDTASMVAALPFSFRYFGADVTSYSATSNGFVQLYATGGAPSTAWANVAIPNAAVPNGFVAPFWDDLFPPGGGGADVRVLHSTSAPEHFTVQWTNWSLATTSASRLTFQAQIFAGTGVIEFHYCTLTPEATGTRSRGSSATIGLEDSSGTNGSQFSFNAASVDTGVGLRFTPNP